MAQSAQDKPARPFRLGLVGAGRMGRAHLDALAGDDAVRIAAVADPSPEARAAVSWTAC
jgi:myo-inositol 2-dehydrogenase/D-chiro-inositol 1-dehydrogenase